MLSHPAHFVACGFGSGLSSVAPGTAGTAFSWATYALLRLAYPDDGNFAVFLLLAFIFGIWCVHLTGKHLDEPDHGSIVWDEIVPFWAALMFFPPAVIDSPHGVALSAAGFFWQLAAFVAFRFFDIVKPAPASFFDQRMKNGVGVMLDDVVAAAYAVLALAAIKTLLERIM